MALRVVVVGGGTMGVGIAHAFVLAGAEVEVVDVDPASAAAACERVEDLLLGGRTRGKVTEEEHAAASSRLRAVREPADVTPVPDLLVEAVPEKVELKREVLAAAEVYEPVVLATNTSSISIDILAGGLGRPERFVGMHFFNPVWASPLVEVVIGTHTGDDAVDRALAAVTAIGKEAIVVRDAPGFASSRLGVALGLEAIRMLEQGVASAQDIDRAMELGYRHPMGPLRLTDLVGLDVRLAIAEYLATAYGPRFEPPALLRDMVAAGRLGKKTGEGFYRWE